MPSACRASRICCASPFGLDLVRREIRLVLLGSALEGGDAGRIFVVPLAENVALRQFVGVGIGRIVGGCGEFSGDPVLRRLQPAQFGAEFGLVGFGEGRVEGGEHLAGPDAVAHPDGDPAHDRGFERLNHDLAVGRDQPPVGADHDVDPGERQTKGGGGEQAGHQP